MLRAFAFFTSIVVIIKYSTYFHRFGNGINQLADAIGDLLFHFMNYRIGLFAKLGPLYLMLIAIAISAAQVIFSHWRLGRYYFSPMEWLARSTIYGIGHLFKNIVNKR